MKLEKWALIAEILSATAVVMSLIFVGLQIRLGAEETSLNTRAVRVSAFQDLTAQISTLNTLVVSNPQFADLEERIMTGGQPETPAERRQYMAYLLLINRQGELAFRQYENGIIDNVSLDSMLGPVRAHVRTEIGREIWEGQTALYPAYREYAENLFDDPDYRSIAIEVP